MIPGVSQINRLCHSQLRLLLRAKEGKKRPKIVNSNHRTEGKEAIKETEHLMKKVGEQGGGTANVWNPEGPVKRKTPPDSSPGKE